MNEKILRLRLCISLAATISAISGCGRDEVPRTRDEIFQDQIEVDTIYFSKNGETFHAPGTVRGVMVDPATGELAWAAWQCNNPDCPKRRANGEAYLFPLPDPFAYVNEQGEPAIRQPQTQEDFERFDEFIERRCPACLELRNIETESDEVRQQYQDWVMRHITPQAEKRLAELQEEMKAYLKRNQPTD